MRGVFLNRGVWMPFFLLSSLFLVTTVQHQMHGFSFPHINRFSRHQLDVLQFSSDTTDLEIASDPTG